MNWKSHARTQKMLRYCRTFWIRKQLLILAAAVVIAGCKPTRDHAQPALTNDVAASSPTNQPTATNLLEAEVEPDIDKSTEHLVRGNGLLGQGKFQEAVAEFK